MVRPALALALLLLAGTVLAPPAAAQLPDNPFDDVACAGPGGSGVVGLVRTIVSAVCGFAVFAGYITYEFVCDLSGAC